MVWIYEGVTYLSNNHKTARSVDILINYVSYLFTGNLMFILYRSLGPFDKDMTKEQQQRKHHFSWLCSLLFHTVCMLSSVLLTLLRCEAVAINVRAAIIC